MRCEARTLDDIRALGGNDAADERRFATAARVSEINLALYRTFAQPVGSRAGQLSAGGVDAAAASAAAAIRAVLRCQSDDGVGRRRWRSRCARIGSPRAPTIRSSRCRRRVSARSSPRSMPGATVSETFAERTFLTVYGSPALQAAVGIDPAATRPLRKAAKNPLHQRAAAEAHCRAQVAHSDRRAARSRRSAALLYVGMTRARGRRARVRSWCAAFAQAHGDITACGVQGAGARAIQHAADR